MSAKKEFGDFQTPLPLAREVVQLIARLIGTPSRVIEPTAGIGAFLDAAEEKWGKNASYEGYEINPSYVQAARSRLSTRKISMVQRDFFSTDWDQVLNTATNGSVLVLGNPPWVTTSDLGSLASKNAPTKTNFQGLRGLDAKTGKSNFDIAEWILISLITSLPEIGSVAMLCKTMTARKVLRYFWQSDRRRMSSSIFLIDAKRHFEVSVDACLLMLTAKKTAQLTTAVYASLDQSSKLSEFGLVDGHLVSDAAIYKEFRDLDGGAPYTWRSGLKHDASDVMELTPLGSGYANGFHEKLDIEDEFVFPLLKSSDVGNGRCTPRKAVIVTQRAIGEGTEVIKVLAPKTWEYLLGHSAKLDGRKSSIYLNRPQFSMFGIGEYSFAQWKVAISGMYKTFRFVVVPPHLGRPVLLDDTCYSVACTCEREASVLASLLNSHECQSFIGSLVFRDSKRPVTIDVLRRISIVALANRLGRLDELAEFLNPSDSTLLEGNSQLQLLMEAPNKYRARRTI